MIPADECANLNPSLSRILIMKSIKKLVKKILSILNDLKLI